MHFGSSDAKSPKAVKAKKNDLENKKKSHSIHIFSEGKEKKYVCQGKMTNTPKLVTKCSYNEFPWWLVHS